MSVGVISLPFLFFCQVDNKQDHKIHSFIVSRYLLVFNGHHIELWIVPLLFTCESKNVVSHVLLLLLFDYSIPLKQAGNVATSQEYKKNYECIRKSLKKFTWIAILPVFIF